MQAKGIPVTYMLFPDEGHGLARPENNTAFNAVTEGFLATCLGGRAEPIGDDFAGSSATVPVGADAVPGLAEVMRSHAPQHRNRVCMDRAPASGALPAPRPVRPRGSRTSPHPSRPPQPPP